MSILAISLIIIVGICIGLVLAGIGQWMTQVRFEATRAKRNKTEAKAEEFAFDHLSAWELLLLIREERLKIGRSLEEALSWRTKDNPPKLKALVTAWHREDLTKD